MSIADKFRDALWTFKRSRRAHVVTVLLGIVLVVVVLGYFAFSAEDELVVVNGDDNPDRIVEGRRVLDGLVVEAEDLNRLPVAVMIDNLAVNSVRPHAGITRASVVYEALVEGGITRLMPVFATGERINEIGSVRSARPYFVQLAQEYHGVFMHAGGSPQALEDLNNAEDLWSIDGATGEGAPYYRRDSDRPAPHNLTTSSDLLAFAARDFELAETGDVEGWQFLEEEGEPASTERALTIDYSTTSYKVEWEYSKDDNAFYRSNGSTEDVDRNDDRRIVAKNVIVQFVPVSLADAERLQLDLVGEGGALVFKDGEMLNVTWKKPSADARTRFFDEDDDEVRFNPGQTWVELLPVDGRVTFE